MTSALGVGVCVQEHVKKQAYRHTWHAEQRGHDGWVLGSEQVVCQCNDASTDY
jgi:hypothetical protein